MSCMLLSARHLAALALYAKATRLTTSQRRAAAAMARANAAAYAHCYRLQGPTLPLRIVGPADYRAGREALATYLGYPVADRAAEERALRSVRGHALALALLGCLSYQCAEGSVPQSPEGQMVEQFRLHALAGAGGSAVLFTSVWAI
jgi:hypothetical protein